MAKQIPPQTTPNDLTQAQVAESHARTTRGRQVDQHALSEVRELLVQQPKQRDLLIEFLHLIQDRVWLPFDSTFGSFSRRNESTHG